jgi:hypothetical protein
VICETKCIWSHYLLLDREKSLPNLALSLRKGAGRFNRLMRLCSFVEQITLPPRDWPTVLSIADAGLQGFSAAC